MKVSEIFQLGKTQYELDFVDIDVEKDTPLFLDPYFLANLNTSWSDDCMRTLESFFDYFLILLKSQNREEAKRLFSYVGEINETCLGMSRGIPQGRGIGSGDTDTIFDEIIESKVVDKGIVKYLEDLKIFVPNIGKDKISDMLTNIIKKHLIEYTQSQCNLWGISMIEVATGYYWERQRRIWETEYNKMLVINGRRILLVPKKIVTYSTDYMPEKYAQHFVLNFLQEQHLQNNTSLVQIRKDGETRYVTKESIKERERIDKEYLANFTKAHPDIFENFKNETKDELRLLTNNELDLDIIPLEDVIEHLKNTLINIPKGSENASKYHKTILGILELLFYPVLSAPKLEQEIHEGRKRIDITYYNDAKSGFFTNLSLVSRIPSPIIFVECKNYSTDPHNPELDQLSGRFSPNRGQFGLLLCREIENEDLFLRRCSDTYHDSRGLILPLTDNDIISMLDNYLVDGIEFCEELLKEKHKKIIFKK